MKHLAYILSFVSIVALSCARISGPVVNTAVPDQQNATEDSVDKPSAISRLPNSALVDSYDPARDPAEDVEQAILIAENENKRILLELGGDWCIWCTYMDEFYAAHSDILQFRADHYILVKINVSKENENEEFLSQYPSAPGYPHIYILGRDGTFLHSQSTEELENGADSYVPEIFLAFLQKWASP
jgi:thioredoxin-related protein